MLTDVIFTREARRWIYICIFFFGSTAILAQKQTDFSGTWIMDNAKSDPEYTKYYGEVTCVIKQTPETFTVEQAFTDKKGNKSAMDPSTCTLDGKERVKEEQGGIDKQSAQWSKDRKTLIVKFVRTMNGNDYGSNTAYSLSSNGKVLTINTSNLAGESPSVQVFNKK